MAQYFILADFSREYLLYFLIGLAYWGMCLLSFILIYSRIKQRDLSSTYHTLNLFFAINLLVTAYQFAATMYHSGSLNPFALWDNPEYGTSTGDHLKGLFLAPCYINFMANSFFSFYFLQRRQLIASVLAVIVLCMTSTNFAIIVFVPVYLTVGLSSRIRGAKWATTAGMAFIVLFYGVISKGNLNYMLESIFKIEHHYNEANIGKVDKTVSTNDVASKKQDIDFFKNKKGKLIAVEETVAFVCSSPKNLLFGAGMGNFSSLLAKRQSDIQLEKKSRLFQKLPLRIAPPYRDNHYTIEKHVYNLSTDWHSIQQLPSSFFNQIVGEYGLLGTLSFLIFYVGFILKRTKLNRYFLPLAALMGYYLLFDYLFEYLSIMVLFELFCMLVLAENKEKQKEIQYAR